MMRNSTSGVRAAVAGAAGAVVLVASNWVAVADSSPGQKATTTVNACVRTDKNVIVAALATGKCPAGSISTQINKQGPPGPRG